MGGIIDQIASIAAPVALSFVPGVGPALAAAYTGISSGIKSGSPLGGLLAAGGSYFGSELGGSLGSSAGQSGGGFLGETPANALGNAFGGEAVGSVAPLGSWAGNALGSQNFGSLIGSGLGSSIGSDIGNQAGSAIMPGNTAGTLDLSQSPFSPSRQGAMGLPGSLSGLAGGDPFQQATNIATKGVYGGGQGKDENNYFLNLINRQLVDPSGNVNGMQSINPIESSYLSQLGLGGYNNSNDLLQGISKYGT